MVEEKRQQAPGVIIGGLGGTVFGAAITALLMAKPAEAAPPEEKLNYLIECLTALIQVLAQVAESNTALTEAIREWLAAQGVPPGEGIEVTVLTPWVAKEPEEIYRKEIRTAGTFYCDRMVNWTKGKRLLLRVVSSLNQAVQIQAIGNINDAKEGSTDINTPQACAAHDRISIGFAWDDWQPYIGAKIIVATAPTAGVLTILAVIQE